MAVELALYGGLFLNAFIAATLFPALSELSFATLLASGTGVPLLLFLTVTIGNVAGAFVNYWLGLRIASFQHRKWFPFTHKQIDQATRQFERFGKWSLLFAWLPIIGDPLTLVAGLLRTDFRFFALLVTIGKATRYALVVLTIASLP